MATRSTIAFYLPEMNYVPSIYCHYDGSPEFVGQALWLEYNSFDKAFELASSGAIRGLLSDKRNENGYYDVLPFEKLEFFEEFHLPEMNRSFDELATNFLNSDRDWMYVWFQKEGWMIYRKNWENNSVEFFGSLNKFMEKFLKENA